MRLTDHDLKQIDETYLISLKPEQMQHLLRKMLDDLREARDRLNQTPQNSSQPSGSFAPWAQATPTEPSGQSKASAPEAEEVEATGQADISADRSSRSESERTAPPR